MTNAPGNMPQTGIRAVIDMSNWDQNSKKLFDSISKIDKSITNFAKSSVGSLTQTSDSIQKMSSFAKRAEAVVYGILVADVFRGIARAARDMAKEALGAVSDFQVLKIQLDTLAARDYAREFGVPVQEAFSEIGVQSQQLLNWIRELAVTTPFSVKEVGSVFALARAYGFASDEAQKLIIDVGDFTASMGLGDEVLRRIIYNMGQMVAQGKPTGRELRDLSNSFVPIGDMAERFAKRLGVTTAAVKDMWSTGQISAKEFIAEFEKMVEEDVPGAMERMSRTLVAAGNNIKDFFQSLVGYEVFGPVADVIAGQIQDKLESLLSPESYRRAAAAGEALLFVYNQIADTVSNELAPAMSHLFNLLGSSQPTTLSFAESLLTFGGAIKFFIAGLSRGISYISYTLSNISENFRQSFLNLQSNMFVWGQNVIIQFANGIATAVTFVIQALTQVARTITSLLQAHSPPLLLPDLERWGASAMTSYMRGWTKGDFGVFNDIQRLIQRAIMSFKITGEKGNEVDLIERTIGTTVQISTAIENVRKFGEVSQGVLDNILNTAGFASDEMRKFITKSFEVAKLESVADAVSEILSFKGTTQISIFGTIVDSFDQIRNMAGKFGSDLSGMVTQYVDESERLLEVNQQIQLSQEDLNRVTKYYDDILEDLNKQLNRVTDQQDDLAKIKRIDKALSSAILTADERKRIQLEKERILLTRQIRDTETEKDTETGIRNERLDALNAEKDVLEKRMEFEKDQLKSISELRAKTAKDELDAIKGLIEAQINLNELLNQSVSVKLKGAGDIVSEFQEDILKGLQGSLPAIEEGFQQALDELWDTIWKKFTEFGSTLLSPFKPVEEAFQTMVDTWTNLFGSPELSNQISLIGKGFEDMFKPFQDFWNQNGEQIATSIGDLIGTIVTHLTMTTPSTGKSVIQILQESVKAIGDTLVQNGPKIQEFFSGFKEFVDKVLMPKFKEILEYIGTQVVPALIQVAVDALPYVLDILKFIVSNADKILEVLVGIKAMNALVNIANLLKLLGGVSPIVTVPLLIFFVTPDKKQIEANTEEVKKEQDRWLQVLSGEEPNGFKQKAQEIFGENFGKDWIPVSVTANRLVTLWEYWAFGGDPTSQEKPFINKAFAPVSKVVEDFRLKVSETFGEPFGKDFVSPSITGQRIVSLMEYWLFGGDPTSQEGPFITKIGPIIAKWAQDMADRAAEILNSFGDWTSQAGEDISNWAEKANEDISSWSERANKDISDWQIQAGRDISKFIDDAKISFEDFKNRVGDIFHRIYVVLANKWYDIFDPVGGYLPVQWRHFRSDIEDAFNTVFGEEGVLATAFSNIRKPLESVWNSIFGEGEGSLSSIIGSFLSSAYNTMYNVGTNLIKGLLDGLGSLWDKLVKAAQDIGKLLGFSVPEVNPPGKVPTWHWEYYDDPLTGKQHRRWVYSKTGANFIVPQRFINDSLGLKVSAGEKVRITPANAVKPGLSVGDLAVDELIRMISSMVLKITSSSGSYGGYPVSNSTVINNDNRITIDMKPSYSQYSSPATVYSDVVAAMAAVMR